MTKNPILDELHAVREHLMHWLTGSKPKSNSQIVLASNHDEQNGALERRSQANLKLRISRRRPVTSDVVCLDTSDHSSSAATAKSGKATQMTNRSSMLAAFLFLTIATTAMAQNAALIRGKSLDEWIAQSKEGATLEDRHTALQVLRNDGIQQNREKTLRAFTDALSAKEPTVQSLAAAGLLKAGRPTDPNALTKLVELISKDLSAAKPSLGNTRANHIEFGLATRVIRAIGEVGDEHQVAVLRRINDNKRIHALLRQFATKAIRQIESRPQEADAESRSQQGNSRDGKYPCG